MTIDDFLNYDFDNVKGPNFGIRYEKHRAVCEELRHITDEAALVRIALNAKDWKLRNEAFSCIHAQEALIQIAMDDESDFMQIDAVKRLHDQPTLQKLLLEVLDPRLLEAAAANLTDAERILAVLFAYGGSGKPPKARGCADKSLFFRLVNNLEDQQALFTIAAKMKIRFDDEHIRMKAIKKLTDETLLIRLASELSANEENAPHLLYAVTSRISDQAFLIDTLTSHSCVGARSGALNHLLDETLIREAATRDASPKVRRAAVARLTDQALLQSIAREDESERVRAAAVRGLTDQALLAEYAQNDPSIRIRRAAIGHLADRDLVMKLAQTERDERIGKAVLFSLAGDQDRFFELAVTAQNGSVRRAAQRGLSNEMLVKYVETVFDQPFREIAIKRCKKALRIAKNQDLRMEVIGRADLPEDIRRSAIAGLKDQRRLSQIVWGQSYDYKLQNDAAYELKDESLLERIAFEHSNVDIRVMAIEKMTKQDVLARLSAPDMYPVDVRKMAANRLYDQAALAKIAQHDPDYFIRYIAVDKLGDKALLRKISRTDPADPVRRCAKAKLKSQ